MPRNTCDECGGSGNCDCCHGYGTYQRGEICEVCDGSGLCIFCDGGGTVEW